MTHNSLLYMFISILYIFRAFKCSSSGDSIVSIRHLVYVTYVEWHIPDVVFRKNGSTVKEIKQYQKKWLQHVQRMDINRIPKQALQYKPKGRRNIGRPRKRWRDQLHLEDQGTGNTPNIMMTIKSPDDEHLNARNM